MPNVWHCDTSIVKKKEWCLFVTMWYPFGNFLSCKLPGSAFDLLCALYTFQICFWLLLISSMIQYFYHDTIVVKGVI